VSGAFENERVQRMDADLDLLNARIEGVSNRVEAIDSHVAGLGDDVTALTESILRLSEHLATMVEKVGPLIKDAAAVSGTGPGAKDRKVWVAEIPDEYGTDPRGDLEVMIEQFGNGAPTVAFRRGGNPAVWGRPFRAVQR